MESSSFDVVVFHTTLCHLPGPEAALAEAHRVLRPGGWLAIFDGDYATSTVALANGDPLQACVEATLATLVHDRWLVRRIRSLVADAGFVDAELRSHGYVVTEDPRYFLATIQLGAETLAAAGTIAPATAQALATEAERRVRADTFFGHIAYASLLALTPRLPRAGLRSASRPSARERRRCGRVGPRLHDLWEATVR